MVPVLQVTLTPTPNTKLVINDYDLILGDNAESWYYDVLQLVVRVASRTYTPKLAHNADFQIARGLLGISV